MHEVDLTDLLGLGELGREVWVLSFSARPEVARKQPIGILAYHVIVIFGPPPSRQQLAHHPVLLLGLDTALAVRLSERFIEAGDKAFFVRFGGVEVSTGSASQSIVPATDKMRQCSLSWVLTACSRNWQLAE